MRLLPIISLLASSVYSVGFYSGGCPDLVGAQDFKLGYHFGEWKVAAYVPNPIFLKPGQTCTKVTYEKTLRQNDDFYFDIENYTQEQDGEIKEKTFPGYYNLNEKGLLKMAKNDETDPKTDGRDIVVFYQSIRHGVAYLFGCAGIDGVTHMPIFSVVSKKGVLSKRKAEAHVKNAIRLLANTGYSVTWASDVEYPSHYGC